MGCCPCFTSEPGSPKTSFQKKNEENGSEGNNIAAFVRSISRRKGSSKHKCIADELKKYAKANNPLTFKFQELVTATDNFDSSRMVGEGGFGRVYKGFLASLNKDVAVKRLDRNGLQGSREFFSEVLMLSLVKHANLVNLIGYCAEEEQRVLVYDLMPNGSLEGHLLDLPPGKQPLDWFTRMKIAQGAAKGLEYLHDYADPPVIYRDFKASNILLDADFNPRLSDFGLARLGPTGGKDHVSTRVMGTYGYCAPEYALTGQLTTKSDVYSFGVVLLEIISGRRAIDNARPPEEQNLITWAAPLLKDRKMFAEIADPLLEGNYPMKGLYQGLAIAAMCLQEEAETRPLMGDVVTALEFLAKPKGEEAQSSPDVDSVKVGVSEEKESNS